MGRQPFIWKEDGPEKSVKHWRGVSARSDDTSAEHVGNSLTARRMDFIDAIPDHWFSLSGRGNLRESVFLSNYCQHPFVSKALKCMPLFLHPRSHPQMCATTCQHPFVSKTLPWWIFQLPQCIISWHFFLNALISASLRAVSFNPCRCH